MTELAPPDARSNTALDRTPKKLPLASRAGLGLCGMLLVAGFFLPWLSAGTTLELSGMGLVFAGGDVVAAVSGSGRFLVFLVPLLGVALVGGAAFGHRWTPWLAAGGASTLLLFGLVHVLTLFLSSTGIGMWLVVLSAFLALVFGMLSIGRAK